MNTELIKSRLLAKSIFYSEEKIHEKPSVIGYEKVFKWSWMANQLNTFIIVTDFGSEMINKTLIEKHLAESFKYAKKNTKGWPRGLNSGLGVISILLSTNIDSESKEYCRKLKSGKKWAAFTIPVIINSKTNESYSFNKKPLWGRVFYPHLRELINDLI